jgi:hypothetical protein
VTSSEGERFQPCLASSFLNPAAEFQVNSFPYDFVVIRNVFHEHVAQALELVFEKVIAGGKSIGKVGEVGELIYDAINYTPTLWDMLAHQLGLEPRRSNLPVAAAHDQHEQFLARCDPAEIFRLDFHQLLANPQQEILRLTAHLSLPLAPGSLEASVHHVTR